MQRKVLLIITALVASHSIAVSEQTVGLFINETEAGDGYVLFTSSYPAAYLIDREGLLINSWKDTIGQGTSTPCIGLDGYLYRAFARPEDAPGLTGVEKVDWSGNVVWHYVYKGEKYGLQHDFDVLPNGNILILAREIKDSLECAQTGADIDLLLNGTMFVCYVIEVQPVGDTGGNIVWEWHVWDHLVQDFDPTKDNYGVVADHPELFDVNWGLPKYDWPHLNTVYYNPKFDQIMLCCFITSELYVIDHSTTTQEAAGHSGGNYGKGGDILYRWGNPQTYGRGTDEDRMNFILHSGSVIPDGYPGAGNMLWLNNGAGRGYSSIDEIVPSADEDGSYPFTPPKWGPEGLTWTWTAPKPEDYFAPMFHGGRIQRLPNGNTIFSDPFKGKIYQVTPDGEIVWFYINPVSTKGPVHQGQPITNNGARIHFYNNDYPGLAGKDLTPKGPIELPGVEEIEPEIHACLEVSGIVRGRVSISYEIDRPGSVTLKLYNALGQEVRSLVDETRSAGYHSMTWDGSDGLGNRLASGVYFLKLEAGNTNLKEKIVLTK